MRRRGIALWACILVSPFLLGASADDSAIIVVSPAGDADHPTIVHAHRAARPGDTILVRPGSYQGPIGISKDITVRGDGPIDGIVITGIDGPILILGHTDATIADLTLRGPESTGIEVRGGAPTLRGLVFDAVGHAPTPPDTCTRPCQSLLLSEGTTAAVVDSSFVASGGIVVHGLSAPRLEGNTFTDSGAISLIEAGDDTRVTGNMFRSPARSTIIFVGAGHATLEDNGVIGAPVAGIEIGPPLYGDMAASILRNQISDSGVSIAIRDASAPLLEGNMLSDNEIAVLSVRSDAVIRATVIRGGGTGFYLDDASVVSDSEVTGTALGVDIAIGAAPTLRRTRVCDNVTNLTIRRDATPSLKQRKRFICEDG